MSSQPCMVENAVDKPAVLEHHRCVVAIITGSLLARIMAMPYFIVDLLNVKVESSIMRMNPCSMSVAVSPRDIPMSKIRIFRNDKVIMASSSCPAKPFLYVVSGKI